MYCLSVSACQPKTIMGNSPKLQYSELIALGAVGGYSNLVNLTEASSVFLLSSMIVLRMRYLWQSGINPVTDSEYSDIIEFIESVETELMGNLALGSLFYSIATITDTAILPLIGQLIAQSDYSELTAIVPTGWLVGTNIQLPDMRDTALIGDSPVSNLGSIIGSNTEQLTIAQIPSHTHTQLPHTHTYASNVAIPALGGAIPATASIFTPSLLITNPATPTNLNTGGDGTHNNIQRSLQAIAYMVVK